MDDYTLGFKSDTKNYRYIAPKGLTREVVEEISHSKSEPEWMREIRLTALTHYFKMPVPEWGADLSEIQWDNIHYYLRSVDTPYADWDQVPPSIKKVFEVIGVPAAEREQLAGVTGQFDSEKIYGSLQATLAKKGVVFLSMDEGLQQYPEIVREYFGTVVPYGDNKLACLNTAVWSGGSFVYVPRDVDVQLPLQAYFRINSEYAGQFERTLIVVEEGATVHYVEGCSAPAYSSGSLHAAVVEVVVKEGAKCRYTTVQNWYKNVYNLVTKRAKVAKDARMEWVDCNLGCLTGDTQLLSPSEGLVRMDGVKVGQTVFAYDFDASQFVERKVTAWQKTGHRKVWEVLLEGRRLRATDNHPFLVLERQDRLGSKSNANVRSFVMRWKPLRDVSRGDMVAYVGALPDFGKTRKLEFQFVSRGSGGYVKYRLHLPKKTNEELLWLLGVYLGDGYMERDSKSKRLRRVYFAVPPQDKARKRLILTLEELFGNVVSTKGICVTINSTAIAEFFEYLGMKGNAHTKRVPPWVFTLPLQERLALLEGCLDTDGNVRRLTHQITFTSAGKELMIDLQQLAISCGLKIYKIRKQTLVRTLSLGKEEKEYTSYQFCISNSDLGALRGHLVKNTSKLVFARVTSIKELAEEDVYDIEVEGSHNFVANGIVVHNSKVTMKYPSCLLEGERAHGEMLSIAVAGEGQHQDAGAKMFHLAPRTTSRITSKSISKHGGRSSYRGMVVVTPQGKGSRSKVVCDALIMDPESRSDTYPTNRIMTSDVTLEHEAYVSKIGEEQLLYLMSRGLTQEEAETLLVRGFLEPVMQELPLEYAVELNRLVHLEMTGSVG